MKQIISSLFLVVAAHMMSAQHLSPEVVATAGESFSTNSLTLDWTLGEVMTETYSGTIVLTQGFHQPALQTTSLEDLDSHVGTVTVYPNPTTDRISIQTEKTGVLQAVLWDMSGRVVLQATTSATNTELDLSELPDGIYLLNLSDGQHTAQSIRINKL